MIPEFFVLVSFFYHFGWVANLIIKRAVKHFLNKQTNCLERQAVCLFWLAQPSQCSAEHFS